MKNSLFIFGLIFLCGTAFAQRFTLDKHLFEDTLTLNYRSYGKISLTSNTEDSMIIKARVFKNTVANYAINSSTFDTTFVYLHYGYCAVHSIVIYKEATCWVSKNDSRTSEVVLIIENKDNNRSMELCLEFFDVLDSTYRDTACFKYHVKKASPTNVAVNEKVLEMKVFPSPTQGKINIDLGNTYSELSYLISDITGKTILQENIGETSKLEINLEEKPGIYFLMVFQHGEILTTQKLVLYQ